MSLEVATKQDLEKWFDQIRAIVSMGPASDKWIMDLAEVKKKTGYSDKMIQDLIRDKKLKPWKEGEGNNAKLRFYTREVMNIIPEPLRKEYGEPI